MNANSKPTSARKETENFYLVEYFYRPLSIPLARLCVKLGISANKVTVTGGLLWMLSIPLLLVGAGHYSHYPVWPSLLIALAATLWPLGFLLDVVDGGVARLNEASGLSGSYLDYCFHLLFNPLFFSALGIFLFVADDLNIVVPILGVLGSAGNWGPTNAAVDQMVIVEASNPKTHDPAARYFTPLIKIRQGDRQAGARGRGVIRQLAEELLLFPGQFSLFWGAVILDLLLPTFTPLNFPVTVAMFAASCTITLISLPFRVHREFQLTKNLESVQPQDCMHWQ